MTLDSVRPEEDTTKSQRRQSCSTVRLFLLVQQIFGLMYIGFLVFRRRAWMAFFYLNQLALLNVRLFLEVT